MEKEDRKMVVTRKHQWLMFKSIITNRFCSHRRNQRKTKGIMQEDTSSNAGRA